MKEFIISRKREFAEIQRCLDSGRSEFIAINGRRRIGKTFLVDTFCKGKYDFTYVGEHNTNAKVQIQNFMRALEKRIGRRKKLPCAKTWYDAFNALEDYLESLPEGRKKVIFIDEMPWMDTQRSNFVSALENFWNGWANRRRDIVLIATGSATSWMSEKLMKNKGGLHNRITCNLHLSPFTLNEVEQYLKKSRFKWDRYQILQCYMVFGGVPFYLSLLHPGLSLSQNIDRLFFAEGAQLRDEYSELFHALFNKAEFYVKTVTLLATHKEGLTRSEIKNATRIEGAFLSKVLDNLVKCDFLSAYSQFGRKNTNVVYRIIDPFTLFYHKFVEGNNSKDDAWWSKNMGRQSIISWQGLSFELVCLLHHRQIKNALGIAGVSTSVFTWKKTTQGECHTEEPSRGAQIDLIIDRADRITHVCEMKFSKEEYAISFDEENKLRHRLSLFNEATKTKLSLLTTFVTTYGVVDGKHKSIVDAEVTMDDLFNS